MAIGDRLDIGYRHWAAVSPRAVFLLVHGLGAHGGRWEAAGDYFMRRGISSYAVELRSIGDPDELGSDSQNFAAYKSKLLRLYDVAMSNYPGKKIFVMGESMGALISFLAALERQELFAGLILLSPAFGNRLKLRFITYLDILISALINPGKKFKLPFDSSMCTRDESVRRRMDDDPFEYRLSTPGLLLGILAAQVRVAAAARRIRIPALFLLAGHDAISDTGAARRVFASLGSADRNLVEFPGMFHSLSIDVGKEKVFGEIFGWVENRI